MLKAEIEKLEKSSGELKKLFNQRAGAAIELTQMTNTISELRTKNQELADLLRRKESEVDTATKELAAKEIIVAQNYNEIVDLKTEQFDMKNKIKAEKVVYEAKIRYLQDKLKERAKPKSTDDKSIQKILTNDEINRSLEKY